VNKILSTILGLILSSLLFSTVHAANVQQGDKAPDFRLNRLDGSEFKLSDFKGKKSVYLVFWTTWCTYCMKKIPKLQHAARILGPQIEIIAVDTSVKDSFAKMQQFQKDRQIEYPLAFDFGKKVTDLYGVWGTPTEFIIDINGVVVLRDGVPDLLSEHLSDWNMIDHRSRSQTLMATKNCNKEQRVC